MRGTRSRLRNEEAEDSEGRRLRAVPALEERGGGRRPAPPPREELISGRGDWLRRIDAGGGAAAAAAADDGLEDPGVEFRVGTCNDVGRAEDGGLAVGMRSPSSAVSTPTDGFTKFVWGVTSISTQHANRECRAPPVGSACCQVEGEVVIRICACASELRRPPVRVSVVSSCLMPVGLSSLVLVTRQTEGSCGLPENERAHTNIAMPMSSCARVRWHQFTIVTGKLLDDLAVLDEQRRGHIAGREFGAVQSVKVAHGKLGLALELVLAKRRGKFRRVAASSPSRSQVHDGLAAAGKESIELRRCADVSDGAILQHLR